MFKEINEDTNLLLWGKNMVKITNENGNIEIVVHPADDDNIECREANLPYCCTLTLEDGTKFGVDLSCEDDWGDIQEYLPDDGDKLVLGWGNDADGHRRIVKVEDDDGRELSLDQFKRDVKDFMIYFEG